MINPFNNFFNKETLKQFGIYLIRWQTGFFVIYPAMKFFGTFLSMPFWLSLILSNVVGGFIFFFVDRVIFGSKDKK